MKKLINAVDTAIAESLDGFAAAHSNTVILGDERKFVRRKSLKPGKVALISGGGSGHEPLHAGFVGFGMLDAACPGQVFTSPTPDQMAAAVIAVDTGAGALFIVKNYEGDVMNFEMAAEMASGPVAMVVTDDDVAVEKSTYSTGRRGVAGTLVVEKIVGAAAEIGSDLNSLQATRQAGQQSHALNGCRADARAPCRLRASRPFNSARTRWRWGSASMASPVGGESSSPRPRQSPTRWSAPFSPTSRRQPARTASSSSTASAGRPQWSSISCSRRRVVSLLAAAWQSRERSSAATLHRSRWLVALSRSRCSTRL